MSAQRYRWVLALLCVASAVCPPVARAAFPDVWNGGRMAVGCNYWASHAGLFMWRNWDADRIERDLDLLTAQGMKVLRVFPLWPDFQPLTADYAGAGKFSDYSQSGGALKNYAAVDDEMVARFRFVCKAAEKRGLKLIVGLITGFMSGRMFVPPALEKENVLTSPAAIMWQARYVRYLVSALKNESAILSWELGNETNCMGEADGFQVWNWFHSIAMEIRLADPTRPIVNGLHMVRSVQNASTNFRQQEELVDVLSTHPYPLFTPNCNRERLDAIRNACQAPCETAYYADMSRKPAFVEEAGSLGPCVASDEVAAAFLRMQLFGSWTIGSPLYVWWCAFDQDRLGFPPYEWVALERELGLFTSDFQPKPAVRELRNFASFVESLPFDRLPPRKTDAIAVITERENGWVVAQGAWLLSRQAGFDIRYVRAEDELPEAPFYILPSGESFGAYTRSAYLRVMEKAARGATVLVTFGDRAMLSGLKKTAGIEVVSSYEASRDISLRVGDRTVRFSEPTTRLIRAVGSQVLLNDAAGNVFMTEFVYGKGKVLFVNGALERNAQIVGWPVYRLAAERAGVKRLVSCEEPLVGLTEHRADDGRTIVVAINYQGSEVTVPVRIDGTVLRILRGACADGRLTIGACDASVFEVQAKQ